MSAQTFPEFCDLARCACHPVGYAYFVDGELVDGTALEARPTIAQTFQGLDVVLLPEGREYPPRFSLRIQECGSGWSWMGNGELSEGGKFWVGRMARVE